MHLRRLSSGGGWSRRRAAAGIARGTPVPGVRRGLQPVNAHAGGTLLQRLPHGVGRHGHSPHLRRQSRQ
ncbi:gamma-glutamyl-gamma-aminobutyrate hydrolase family protein [Streptomyces sp. SAJ15]|uniref:gamma-glutamyl-gamma-aminobutyrate hydrolase family protein n=1 Tax=Streptomyces sp. SAJ15 TaxID=2011095 RepID=UPI00118655A0